MKGKRQIQECGFLGGSPLYESPLHVGQLNFPSWERFREEMQGIFDRRYFTNHGPKVNEFEKKLADHLGARDAVCMTNGTVALMVAMTALGLTGKVIVPSFTFIATVQALTWAGLEPVFCDVDPKTHNISAENVERLIDDDVSGILGVHLWGRPYPLDEMTELAGRYGLRLLSDAAHAIGCSYKGRMIGNFGDAEVFSLHATKIMNSAEGGFAATNDADVAARLRTIRNFHSSETFINAPLRLNGKMTEAQAVMGLMSLEDLPANCRRNKLLYDAYFSRLSAIPGLETVTFDESESNNHQYLIVDVDPETAGLSRDELVLLLKAENILARRYFTPGVHRSPPYCDLYPQYLDALPVSDALSERLMQLPLGEGVRAEDVDTVCAFLRFCLDNAEDIAPLLREKAGTP